MARKLAESILSLVEGLKQSSPKCRIRPGSEAAHEGGGNPQETNQVNQRRERQTPLKLNSQCLRGFHKEIAGSM